MKSVPRLYVQTPLASDAPLTLDDKQSHYLRDVMRLSAGDKVALFNGCDGQWMSEITAAHKREVIVKPQECTRPQHASPDMMVCFAPPRGGRIDSIIEKATELGARILQPVRCERSVVDKINAEKWELTVREAAEQSERLDVPDIRPMVTLMQLMAGWDAARPLIYGDESGASPEFSGALPPSAKQWAILTGPEGGFSPAELAGLRGLQGGHGVSLGPRILRTDTAVITLCALTQARFGDWEYPPHFVAE